MRYCIAPEFFSCLVRWPHRHLLSYMLSTLVLVFGIASNANAVSEAASGFQRPITESDSGTGLTFLQLWDYGGNCGKVYHPGKDLNVAGTSGNSDRGTDILAVADGVVRDVAMSTWGTLVIEHNYKGTTVYSQYGHLGSILVNEGDTVTKGQHIGEMGNTGTTYVHLHFEIRKSSHPDPTSSGYFCGLAGKSQATVMSYYEDPIAFVGSHPAYVRSSYFDGTGSLVDPKGTGQGCKDSDGFGCYVDYVKLHSHTEPSVGFFQIVTVPSVCESVELKGASSPYIQGAKVELRTWDGYGTESQYYEFNGTSAVIPLKKRSVGTQWNLIAVQTLSPIPLGSTRLISAHCVSSSYATSNVRETAGEPTQFNNSYHWGGNGSIIGHSNNTQVSSGFGKTRDDVVLMRDYPTLAALQVTKSSCTKMRFTTPVSLELSWKNWDSENWLGTKTIVNGELFTLPIDIGYWAVLKIKAPATKQNGSMVRVVCE
jgi:murein DD-endopeptidase MepM/ murein hydrolase activator NlpD